MKIELETLCLRGVRNIQLPVSFPLTPSFSRAIVWLSKRTNSRTLTLLRLVGFAKESINRSSINKQSLETTHDYLLHSHSQEERAYLLLLLSIFGYKLDESIRILGCDYAFRHREFLRDHKSSTRAGKTYINKILLYTDVWRTIKREQRGQDLDEWIEKYKQAHPEVKQSNVAIRKGVKRHFIVEPMVMKMKGRRYGLLKPLVSTAYRGARNRLYMTCFCNGCGKRKDFRAGDLLRKRIRSCPTCKHKSQKRITQLVFNVETGRRYKTVPEAYRSEKITSIQLRAFERRLQSHRITKIDGGIYFLCNPHSLRDGILEKYLPKVGLPTDHKIPLDPDAYLGRERGYQKALATRRRRANSVFYQRKRAKKRLMKRLTATLDERNSDFWSINNIKEYRERIKLKGAEIRRQVIANDPLLSPTVDSNRVR